MVPADARLLALPTDRPAAQAAAGTVSDAARERRHLAQRLAMLRMILASYWIDAGMLTLFWLAGAMALDAALIAFVGGTLACGVFGAAYVRGWCDGWHDRNLALPQVLAATVVQLAVAWRAPEATLMALMVLFIIFSIAALQLSWRHILAAWLASSAAIVLVVARSGEPLALPGATTTQSLLSALWLALVLGRCAGVGLHGSSVRRKLGQRTRELAQATAQLEIQATRDGLTGALNRNAIAQVLREALGRHDAERPTGVLLVDMDHFKSVNDRHGHAVGDEVLRRFVQAAACVLRTGDRLGRYGGEEFLVVLPSVTGIEAARSVAQRLCDVVAAHDWDTLAPGLKVTLSIGLALAQPSEEPEDLVARADHALYRSKDEGRNGVRVAPPGPGLPAVGSVAG